MAISCSKPSSKAMSSKGVTVAVGEHSGEEDGTRVPIGETGGRCMLVESAEGTGEDVYTSCSAEALLISRWTYPK